MSIDFRKCLYALSDVVMNRPPPIRVFDQIYMKLPDMLLQAEVISRWFDKKKVAFIGDGDAIALTVAHLSHQGLFLGKPKSILVLDFDERIVNSINQFSGRHGMSDLITGELYNVADPLPHRHWGAFDAFHTNPPFGASNSGTSVRAFVRRGIEACHSNADGCIVIGDDPSLSWTHEVLRTTQDHAAQYGYRIMEMLPRFHRYHLDDSPGLTSCCMIVGRRGETSGGYSSQPLGPEELRNFYGKEAPLGIRYVRDPMNGGKLGSKDFHLEPYEEIKSA